MLSIKLANYEKGSSASMDANMILVEDSFGNPLLIVCEHKPGVVTVASAHDPNFDKVLKSFGIDKTVFNSNVKLPPLSADCKRFLL